MEEFFNENGTQVVQTALVIVAIAALWLFAARVARRTVDRLDTRGPDAGARARTLWSMARRILLVVLVALLILMIAAVWSLPLTPLLAVGSAVGVAVGFGAQSLVKDVIAGFFILAEDQYHIGDVVTLADVTGSVVDIRPRVTVLRDLDGNVHYVPNGEIKVSTNLTQEFGQVVLDVGVAYKESVDRVIEVIRDELTQLQADEEWSSMVLEEPQVLGVNSLGDSAVTIRAVLKVTPDERWLVKREGLRRIKNRLDAEGIEIPFPHMTVYRGDIAE
ncbi:MAG: mechanosensitive ion channel family protein [Acidimicrobiia bacterium]|nr:mechanosensitive ion channel family protein [Acidimicrobiia bacterium]